MSVEGLKLEQVGVILHLTGHSLSFPGNHKKLLAAHHPLCSGEHHNLPTGGEWVAVSRQVGSPPSECQGTPGPSTGLDLALGEAGYWRPEWTGGISEPLWGLSQKFCLSAASRKARHRLKPDRTFQVFQLYSGTLLT